MANVTKKTTKKTADKRLIAFVGRWSTAVGLSIQFSITNLFSRMLPLVGGGLFGIGIYEIYAPLAGVPVAVAMAVITAGGIEAVGFMASKRAIQAHADGKPLLLPVTFVAMYLLIGGGALWFTDAAAEYKMMTTAVFLMVAILYALIGMETIERAENKTAVNDLERQRELEDEARARVLVLEDRALDEKRADKEANRANKQAAKMASLNGSAVTVSPSAVTIKRTPPQSSSAVSEAYLRHFTALHGMAGEFTTAQARSALGLSDKGTGNVLREAVSSGVLNKQGRGVYVANGVDPSTIAVG